MRKVLLSGLGLAGPVVVVLLLAGAAPGAGQPGQGLPEQLAALTAQVRDMGQQIAALSEQVNAQGAHLSRLQTQVDGIANPAAPFVAHVHCAEGDTVAAALAEAALYTGPAEIVIHGMCQEAVVLSRSDTVLEAGEAGSGLNPGTGAGSALEVASASRVAIADLTLTGAGSGLSVFSSDVTLFASRIVGNAREGIGVSEGAVYLRAGNEVRNNGYVGIIGWSDARIGLDGVDVLDNAGSGIRASTGSIVGVNHSRIAGNGGAGIELWFNSTLAIEHTVIEDNAAGISTFGMASALLNGDVTIQGNHGDGLNMHDISVATFWGPQTWIRNNTGWGIYCHGEPAVAQLATADVSGVTGNAAGEVSCRMP